MILIMTDYDTTTILIMTILNTGVITYYVNIVLVAKTMKRQLPV